MGDYSAFLLPDFSPEEINDHSCPFPFAIREESVEKRSDPPISNIPPRGAGNGTDFLLSSLCPDDADDDLFAFPEAPRIESKYDLRVGSRDLPWHLTTYLDNDKSGDFNPSSKRPTGERLARRKRKRDDARSEGTDRAGKPENQRLTLRTWQCGRWQGLQSHLVLRIGSSAWNSERGIALAAALKAVPDNWPVERNVNREIQPNPTELSLDSIRNDRLRRRRAPHNRNDVSSTAESLQYIGLGHPAARGCKACFELGIVCNLVAGATYPCEGCRYDREECDLILEPKQKQGCDRCARRRAICSFRTTSDHRGACKQCQQKGFRCVAGPYSGRTRCGPSLDQPNEKPKKKQGAASKSLSARRHRQWAEGIGSTEAKQGLEDRGKGMNQDTAPFSDHVMQTGMPEEQNSVKYSSNTLESTSESEDDEEDPCPEVTERANQPVQHGRSAHPNQAFRSPAVSPNNRGRGLPNENQPVLKHTESHRALTGTVDPKYSPYRPEKRSWSIKTIRTRFSHPISFNCEAPLDGSVACHWCADLYYGLFGYPERRVEVIDCGRDGYVEIEGGYVGEGKIPSRMCWDCTSSRFDIVGCRGHRLSALTGTEAQDFDVDKLEIWRRPGAASSAPFRWCSVCPCPARYACRSQQANSEGADIQIGCGLILCRECATDMMADKSGDVSALIASKDSGTEGRAVLRADAEFLHRSGHLVAWFR